MGDRVIVVVVILFLMGFVFVQDHIHLKIFPHHQPASRYTTEYGSQSVSVSGAERGLDSDLKSAPPTTQTDPAKPSTEDLGLFLESHGLPRILAKEAWVYGKTIQAVLQTGNNPRSGDLATDQALTSWSNICVMRLTRKYRMEPEVIRQFFAVIQSINPALKP